MSDPMKEIKAFEGFIERWRIRGGESLSPAEAEYFNSNEIEPGYMDHSSREVLWAYREGYQRGYTDAQADIADMGNTGG
jgi:hypothetical protein